MNDVKGKYLPIGTVCILKGGSKKVMITGFYCSAEGDDKVYDYNGCPYPEGYLDNKNVCLFDHEKIETIFFRGYENEEEFEFKKRLNNLIEEDKIDYITEDDFNFDDIIELDEEENNGPVSTIMF